MRIGSLPAAATQQSQSRPTSAPSPATPSFRGGSDFSDEIFAGARRLAAVANSFYDEDVKKRDFEAQKEYYRVTGELLRAQDEFMTSAPSNGDGITQFTAEAWEKQYTGFLSKLEPDLQPRYGALGENFKQEYLRRAETQQRAALRGDAMRTLDEFLTSAGSTLIANPEARDQLEGQFASLLASAPGLTDADRKDFARKGLEASALAATQGALFRNNQRAYVNPLDALTFASLAGAVEFAESGGNPNAVSPTGVVGVMQVTVGTAREIARALEDTNFPHGGTAEQVQAYIRDPNVSRQYGQRYLKDQLIAFGGDVEAALIAYNAGPARARQWLRAGRNYDVIGAADGEAKQRETMGYTRRVMARMGIKAEAEILADPDLTPEAKLQAANAARQQGFETQQAAARNIAAQRESRVNAATAAIMTGAGLEQVSALVRDSVIEEGDADWTRLVNLAETQRKRMLDATEAVRLYAAGATAMKPEHLEELTAPFTGKVVEGDPEATQMFMQVWQRLGDASPSMQGAVRSLLSAPDERTVLRGMALLDAMSQTHTAGWNNKLDAEFGAARAVYRAGRRQGMTDQEIVARFRPFKEPGAQAQYAQRRQRAEEELRQVGYEPFADALGIDLDPADMRMDWLRTQAHELYMEIAPLYPNDKNGEKEAKQQVIETLKERFGTYNGRSDYMPPNLAYPADPEGKHEWITTQVIRTSGRMNINPRTPIQFETNPWNQQEFDRTGRRTYTVTYTRDNTFEIENLEAKPSLTPQEALRLEELRETQGLKDTIFHWQPDPAENAEFRRVQREAVGATGVQLDSDVKMLQQIERSLADPSGVLDAGTRRSLEAARDAILRRR